VYNIHYLIWDEYTKKRKRSNHKWRNWILKKHRFLDTSTCSKRTFTNHCYVDVVVTSYTSRTVHQHTEHKKQLLYFLERHRISYQHGYGHRTALIWIRWTITRRAYWSSECITHAFVTSVTSRRVWLKSGRSLTRRSSTGRSAGGVYVWGHAFNKKEDTLSTGCETVDKLFVTDYWLPPMLTSNFQRCISDVNKMDVVAYFSKLSSHPSCLDVRLLCLKFHPKLTCFYWII